MARQIQMAAQFPPVSLLSPTSDAAGRTGSFRTLKNAEKAWVVARINQGNAATVQVSLLQAKDVAGTGSKAINAVPVWVQNATATSDQNVAQSNANGFTTDATLADKLVLFEITPEVALDIANGYKTLAVQTSASNAANVTEATLFVYGSYQQAVPPSTYTN